MSRKCIIGLVFLLFAIGVSAPAESATFNLLCAGGSSGGGRHNLTWNKLNETSGGSGTWKQLGGCLNPYPVDQLLRTCVFTWCSPVASSGYLGEIGNGAYLYSYGGSWGFAWWYTYLTIPGQIYGVPWFTGPEWNTGWRATWTAYFNGHSGNFCYQGSCAYSFSFSGPVSIYGSITSTYVGTCYFTACPQYGLYWSGNTLSQNGGNGNVGTLTFWH